MTAELALMRPLPDQQVAIEKFRKVPAALCGDSMGVGKTVTGIGRDFQLRKDFPNHKDGPTLIICEKIGIDVWDFHLKAMGVPSDEILLINPADRSEFEEALGNLRGFQAYKPPRMTKRGTVDKRSSTRKKLPRPKYRYYVVHYEALIRLEQLNLGGVNRIEWMHVIADEVHLIKNRKALRTIELKRIKTQFKSGLSGTPADDKPQDLWSVLHWLYPSVFSNYWKFYGRYVQFIQSNQVREWNEHVADGGTYEDFVSSRPGSGYRVAVGVQNIQELHRIIAPFYIRRTLLDVAPNMPRKMHVTPPITVKLGRAQRREYEAMRDKAIALIGSRESADSIDDSGRSRGGFTLLAPAVIAVLTRLQQMALATLTPEWDLPDSEFVDDDGWEDDEWDLPKIVLSKPSPKLDAVMNLIETHEDESFVVFTQFRGMADLIEEECQTKKISVVKIHGGITSKDVRTELVKSFQDGQARVFVGTIAAAGKTITLTRAAHVIFTDLSWNPSKNEQAEDRLWRRTQLRPVMVHRIDAEDTIDQVRFQRITQKGDWIKALLNPRYGLR